MRPDLERHVLKDLKEDTKDDIPKLLPDDDHIEDGLAKSAALSTDADPYLCQLTPEDDPKCLPLWRKWIIVLVLSFSSLCATFASSVASFTETGLAEDLHTTHEVTVLSISLYVIGLGVGPLVFAPLSELYGRNNIYRVSYVLFFAFTWPTAFPPDIAVFLVFRFISGVCGSTFLSVTGGSLSDLFDDRTVATPTAVYTLSPLIGPIAGPVVGGFIVQNTDWRWCYRTLLIWQFVQIVLLFTCVPETYVPVILKRKAQRLRKTTGEKYYALVEHQELSISRMILASVYTPFQLLFFDRMALALDIWSALLLGIVYLSFQAFPTIFGGVHHFDVQSIGLTFLGTGVGYLCALPTMRYWNKRFAADMEKYKGNPPPEVRLTVAKAGAIIAPLGLYVMAFTTYKQVHWIGPIIGSAIFGAGMYLIYAGVFTYLVTAYRPIAASALAANSALRSTFAAVFPLFAEQMYNKLGTVGATALLAGLTTLMAPLPFIFYLIGARLRKNSRFAVA